MGGIKHVINFQKFLRLLKGHLLVDLSVYDSFTFRHFLSWVS